LRNKRHFVEKKYTHWSECLKSAVNILTVLYRR